MVQGGYVDAAGNEFGSGAVDLTGSVQNRGHQRGVGDADTAAVREKSRGALFEERDLVQPRLRVEQMGVSSFALQCRHCGDAQCLEACMTGAMHRDENGNVICDEDKCVGCWMCLMVCPVGAVSPGAKGKTQKVASKCDLCGMQWKDAPPCVANCPNAALKYEDRESPPSSNGKKHGK